MKHTRKRKILIISMSLVTAVAFIFGVCAVYLGDYYRADENSIAAFAPINEVCFSTLENGSIVFEPEDPTAGFIFYPGGKVENDAYKPLMAALAREGVLCVLVEMPFNLAVFDINAADGIQEQYAEIEDWYIGGHSLGGSMAASYLADHVDEYEGLILLGSYSTADLSNTDLEVLSVYGSEDKVLNCEKYNENRSNLPDGFNEVVIEGGCHAQFGMYGVQKGDGIPTVSGEEQLRITVENIVALTK